MISQDYNLQIIFWQGPRQRGSGRDQQSPCEELTLRFGENRAARFHRAEHWRGRYMEDPVDTCRRPSLRLSV